MQNPAGYRKDIDGLRALAVLSVILFHLKLSMFSGGFVGVDVFFVISGYLITRQIRDEKVSNNQFSFKNFYIRRARRLFPALLTTVVFSLILASVFFEPQHFKRLAGAAIYSLTFFSNVYFWQEGGYFSLSADYKPLLHTWSLSVEEQFYLIYPAMLVFTLTVARKITPLVITLVLISSLLLSDYLYYDGKPYAVFFLLPSRFFEFLIGAAIVFLPHNFADRQKTNSLLSVMGLLLILYAVIYYDSTTPSPTLYALIPCVGAALLIFAGPTPIKRVLLENRIANWLGKTSYSLYLVHWPLFVFYWYASKTFEPSGTEILVSSIGLFLGTIILGALLHYLVEKPYRHPPANSSAPPQTESLPINITRVTDQKFTLGYLFIATTVIFVSSIFWAKGAINWRESAEFYDRDEVNGFVKAIARADSESQMHAMGFTQSTKPKVLLIGDSHVVDLGHALYSASVDKSGIEFELLRFTTFCLTERDFRHVIAKTLGSLTGRKTACERQKSNLLESTQFDEATHIITANWLTTETVPAYLAHLTKIKERTRATILVTGQNAIFTDIDDYETLITHTNEPLGDYLFGAQSQSDIDISHQLKEYAEDLNLTFIDRAGLVCDSQQKTCDVLNNDNSILYRDAHHWTLEGRKIYGEKLLTLLDKYGAPLEPAS